MENISEMLAELNKDIPEAIPPSREMTTANQVIEIFKGRFEIGLDKKRCLLQGVITFNWFPQPAVRFQGEVVNDAGNITNDFLNDDLSIYINDLRCGTAMLTRRFIGANQILEGFCDEFIEGDKSVNVKEIHFSLPNFRKYMGRAITNAERRKFTKGRLAFEDELYMITLDKVFDYDERFKDLAGSGGYLILYGGRITCKKGAISMADLPDLLERLNIFLSFLNGRRVALFFLKGWVDDVCLWTDYSSYNCADHRSVLSWSEPVAFLNFNDMWIRFSQLWKTPEDREFLQIAINWYIESNAGTGLVEGSIILTQAALELLYNWLIVETRKMIIGRDAEEISAANKIRLLLSQLKTDSAIPDAFPRLKQYAGKNKDASETLVGMRNALVHGNKTKRSDFFNIDAGAKLDALQLGLWYVELSTLFILNYNGKYHSRAKLTPWRDGGITVPWAEDEAEGD